MSKLCIHIILSQLDDCHTTDNNKCPNKSWQNIPHKDSY